MAQTLSFPSALPAEQFQCARGPEEDWTGTGDPKVRRKLQNRLNQRAYRRRKNADRSGENATDKPLTNGVVKWTSPKPTSLDRIAHAFACSYTDPSDARLTAQQVWLGPNPDQKSLMIIEKIAILERLYPRISPDNYFFSLCQFNVIRAFHSNLDLLQLPLHALEDDNYVSPFTMSSTIPENIPPGLQPTVQQMVFPHHPWLDLFPCPKVRDNFIDALAKDDDFNEDSICIELCHPDGKQPLLVWGPSEHVDSWEVTETFTKDWGWVLKGCYELQRATNKWREARGDDPLRFEEINDE